MSLKIGVYIIILRNINAPILANRTRLAVKNLMSNVIEVTILNDKSKGEDVRIPWIPIIPNDTPFDFKRLQFTVHIAFSMTINKEQGQSLQVCGLNLENPCFTRGQLYVLCSRVGQPKNVFVYAKDGKIKNTVPISKSNWKTFFKFNLMHIKSLSYIYFVCILNKSNTQIYYNI